MTEISVIFVDSPTRKDSLRVNKKLGQGKFIVYQVHSAARQANYALKIFPKTSFGIAQYKKEALMFTLNHPNIISYIPTRIPGHLKFVGIVTEYAQHGDFFDIVMSGILSNELLIRTYFHQLIDGLEYIHKQGIAHLDLKLENLLMGTDFLLKITDFDQSQLVTDKQITSGGTQGYRAPEILNGSCEDLIALDVYSAGIILFALLTQELPFIETTDPSDKNAQFYSLFLHNNHLFWAQRCKRFEDKMPFSEELIELINGMLSDDPKTRMRIADIKNCKWYKGPILEPHELKLIMNKRLEDLKLSENIY